MGRKTWFARRRGSMLACATMGLLTALAIGSPASAAGNSGWRNISGGAAPSTCGGADFAIELTGDLAGCWTIFPESYSCKELNGFARYRESGREEFDGTLYGEPGDFVTTYTFEGAFAQGFCSSFNFVAEFAGSCDHYVRGTNGAFTGVVGHISFFDIIPGISTSGSITPGSSGATDYFYAGEINRPRPDSG